jgi:uncharacterized protein (TIGR02145 family)
MKTIISIISPVLIVMVGISLLSSCENEKESPKIVTDKDGNVYNIIKIGNQEWLGRNLNVTHYNNGDNIVNALGTVDQGGWINYGNSIANGDVYGKLYNSYAVHDSRGLAPAGWHVATKDEWLEMINFLGGLGVAGGKLKETGLGHWLTPNTDATDEYGFKALPGGYAGGTGSFIGNYASFWTSSYIAEDTYSTYNFYLYYNNTTVEQDWDFGGSGYSVRCVRD